VTVVRRGQNVVYLRSPAKPPGEDRTAPASAKGAVKPLQPGERVVTEGAIELRAALEDLQTSNPK
jgi:hypothetical protein